MKLTMTRGEALAVRLVELWTKLGGSSPGWIEVSDHPTIGALHGFKEDMGHLSGPGYPMDHWRAHFTSESGMGFSWDDLAVYPRRPVPAEDLALYFMLSRMMFDMTS